jgi:DNA invertase Pin-like site-specific DNA recombinase
MKVALYARYSSDQQRDASIEDQFGVCRAHAAANAWQIADSYCDRAISGASLLRPGIQALLGDAQRGQFNIVIAEAMDRLSRDQEDVAGIYKRLKFAGVKIITLAEGEISELHVGLKGTMNALFLKDLADKTRRGLRGRVEKGKSGGGLCYGYRAIRKISADGEPIRGDREIVAAEADIVRRIFTEFASGRSPKHLVFELNRLGVPGPMGKGWTPSTIHGSAKRGNGILNNELYVGKLVWNRQRFLKDPSTGKRIARLNPREEWIVSEVPELRIIEDELWDAVKAKQTTSAKSLEQPVASKGESLKSLNRQTHIFSGLLVCGSCMGSYTIRGRDRYACANHYARGTCGNKLGIARQSIEERVLSGLKHRLVSADAVAEAVRAFHEETNRLNRDRRSQAEEDKKALAKVMQGIKSVIDSIEEGMFHPSMKGRMDELEAQRAELEAKLSAAPDDHLPDVLPNIADVYRRKIERLSDALSQAGTSRQAASVIRSLIGQIVLTPSEDNNHLMIDLHGELAAVIALASGKSESATPQNTSGRFALVAGARIGRERQTITAAI